MNGYEMEKLINSMLFVTLEPSEKDVRELLEKVKTGQITNPKMTYQAVCNYKVPETQDKATKLWNLILNLEILGISHDDICWHNDVIWDYIDKN